MLFVVWLRTLLPEDECVRFLTQLGFRVAGTASVDTDFRVAGTASVDTDTGVAGFIVIPLSTSRFGLTAFSVLTSLNIAGS